MKVEGASKFSWVPLTVAAMEHSAVSGDKALARTAAALAYGLAKVEGELVREGGEEDGEGRGGGMGKFERDVELAGALVDAHAECTRTIVAVGMGKGGGEDSMEVSAASAHAFGEVYRLAISAVDKVGEGESAAKGELKLLKEAVKHAREAINGDKDSNPMVEDEWNPEGWKQVRQATKADWLCKALEGNFEGTPEIKKLRAESSRLVEALSQTAMFSAGEGDELEDACNGLIQAITSR